MADLRSLVEQLARGLQVANKQEETPAPDEDSTEWQAASNEYSRAQWGSVWPGVAPRQVPVPTMAANIYRQAGPGQVGLIVGKQDRYKTVLNAASDLYSVVMHFVEL